MVSWNISTTNINKRSGSVTMQLVRSGLSTLPIKVSYTTYGVTASTNDFIPVPGVASFASGETSKSVSVGVLDDRLIGPSKQFLLDLISASGGAWLGDPLTCVVNILDTNSPPRLEAPGLSNGVFRTQIRGGANLIVTVQSSSNLLSWLPLQTFTNPPDPLTVIDTNRTSGTGRFYRVVVP